MKWRKLLTFFSMVVIIITFGLFSQRCYAIRVEQSFANEANGNVLYITTRSYSEQNKVTEVKTVDLKNKVLVDYIYGYDKAGNVISEKDILNGNYREFSFDSSNQLVAEKYYDTSGKLTKEINYKYDTKGNRTNTIVSYDNAFETTGYEYNNLSQITKVNNKQDYKYDETGNLIQNGKKTNTFNNKGELIQVKQDNKVIESYQYNEEGQRIKKESDAETEIYTYSDGQLSSITDETGKLKISFARDTNGNLVSMSDNENTYWYLFDGSWNVKGLTDKDGAKVVSYEYDSWGNCIQSEGKSANPFMFMGYQYDARTGYYYLDSRYYSPDTGRFISADGYTKDALAKSNLYKYANNNPLRYKDTTGHWIEAIDSKLPDWAQDEIRSLTVGWNYAVTDEAKDRIHAKANCIRAYAEKQNPIELKGISVAFTVYKDSSGDDVRSLQQALKDTGKIISVDGQFGSKTYVALCQYQESKSLLKDGVAGINTWAKLGEVYYGANYSKLEQPIVNIPNGRSPEIVIYEGRPVGVKVFDNANVLNGFPIVIYDDGSIAIDPNCSGNYSSFLQLLNKSNWSESDFNEARRNGWTLSVSDSHNDIYDIKLAMALGTTTTDSDLGVVYLRTNTQTGAQYIGQSKSMARYIARQWEHSYRNGQKYEFEILGRAKSGTDLNVLEQNKINEFGGPKKYDGTLENARNQISRNRWDECHVKGIGEKGVDDDDDDTPSGGATGGSTGGIYIPFVNPMNPQVPKFSFPEFWIPRFIPAW